MKKLLLVAFAAFAFSCSSDDSGSSDNNGVNNGNDNGVAFIKGKMDDVAFNYNVNNDANDTFLYNALSGFSGEGSDRWYYYGGAVMTINSQSFAPGFSIAWNNMYYGQGGDEEGETAAFYNSVGNLPSNYLTSAQDDAHLKGIEIAYESANGTFYGSKGGSQTGSTMTVTKYTQGTTFDAKTMQIEGTFSCKLYNDEDAGYVITVSDGKFKLILTSFQ